MCNREGCPLRRQDEVAVVTVLLEQHYQRLAAQVRAARLANWSVPVLAPPLRRAGLVADLETWVAEQ